jgi:TIR domain
MIFLSYAQKDGTSYVERLETALQAAGFETWRDKSNLHPASRIDVTIEDNIEHSDVGADALKHIGTPEALEAIRKWRASQGKR